MAISGWIEVGTMGEKINFVLQRVDSRHLSNLWLFYRDFFKSDEDCLDFIFSAVQREPVYSEEKLTEKFLKVCEEDDYVDPDDPFLSLDAC